MKAGSVSARAVLAALDAISALVPPADRAAWRGEWHAEFLHLFATPSAAARPGPCARLGMALRHAWWLRTNPTTPRFKRGGNVFDHIRHAARALRREPAFTLPAILTLALGIGANIAVFSVLEAVLLRPLPYPAANRLVVFRHHDLRTDLTKNFVASTDVLDIAARQQSFESVVPYTQGQSTLYGFAEPIDVQVMRAGDALFAVATVLPELGRGLTAQDTREQAEPVALLSHEFWQKQFSGDPAIIGRSLTVGTISRRVVGIAPPGFNFPPAARIDMIVPLVLPATSVPRDIGGWIFAAGRLKPGITVATADAELRALSGQLAVEFTATNKGTEYFGLSVRDALVGDTRRPLLLLMAAVSVVLLIALVNVSNLLLVRATSRQGEFALRVALGAERSRLFAQLLAENLLLTGVAAVAGAALAALGTSALVALVPASANVPALAPTGVNLWVLGYAALITIAAAIFFSLFAAAYSDSQGAARALVSQTRHSMSKAARRTASAMVIVEVALAVVLLVGAGLITRSFSALLNVDPGFDRAGVSTLGLQLPPGRYQDQPARAAFFSRAMPALAAIPDVAVVGSAAVTPLTGNNWSIPFVRSDRPLEPGQRPPDVGWQVASGGYFGAIKIPLRSGRVFEARDVSGPPVVVISESIERKYFDRGEHAVGHRVKFNNADAEIVGVVGDIRRASLIDAPRADMYLPFEQQPGGTTLFLRTTSGRPVDAAGVRAALRGIEPNARLTEMTSLASIAEDSAASTRLVMWLLGVFGGVSLLLAAIGVYGVLSYAVRQRLREFATRVALGATGSDILWLVMRQGAMIVFVGLATGIGVSLVATQALRSLLFSVTAHDPSTLVAAVALLLAATILGCYVPARRAARTDTARALAE